MVRPLTTLRALTLAALSALSMLATAADAPPLRLSVDATDLTRRIFRVQQTLPVQPGPLTLYLPRWLPGNHAPTGDITRLAGLQIRAGDAQGPLLPWLRDPLDTHAFTLTVPAGVQQLALNFEHLSAVSADSGRVVVTPEMLNLQWNNVVLYPAGKPAAEIPVQATLKLPAGWQHGTALRPDTAAAVPAAAADTVRFATVSLEALVDSPVFAGRHFRRIPLDADGTPRPVVLNLVADSADLLQPSEAQLQAHRQLVQQADKLFGARHFQHYDFLLSLTDFMGGIGLEHHQSSENGVTPKYWQAWDKSTGARALLPHEYAHSWNGKFRRPLQQVVPHFNLPLQNSLLWLYEGQTEFWGRVLAARSGLVAPELTRDDLAQLAAGLDSRSGRRWRNLQDTTQDAIMGGRRETRDWRDWQRTSADYYIESTLIWLEADMLMRERSGGAKGMDDFARAFFGAPAGQGDGVLGPLPYSFDDIVATLNAVVPLDWASFLRERLDGHGPGAPLAGLTRAGWRLAWREAPSENQKAAALRWNETDHGHSLGLWVGKEGRLSSVRWDSPAFDAGLAPGMALVAVNGLAFNPERLAAAITGNKDGQAPIELLVRDAEHYRSVKIDWRGGLRYPALERIPGTDDKLSALLKPR